MTDPDSLNLSEEPQGIQSRRGVSIKALKDQREMFKVNSSESSRFWFFSSDDSFPSG